MDTFLSSCFFHSVHIVDSNDFKGNYFFVCQEHKNCNDF